ncbi:MAG: META domain-containing protein [Chloroflexi bacterium]|nr:META domain-containing protein [Chloroflexota bacterium]
MIPPEFCTKFGYHTTDCNAFGFAIVAENEHRYQLTPGVGTAMSCSEIQERQYHNIAEAVRITTEYEMQGNQLFLFGDGVRITLEIDNPK